MNKKIIAITTLAAGFLLGASALSALAADWAPPDGPPPHFNVDAPINVGDSSQTKTGLLSLAHLLFNPTGVANITVGSVLTATNADGTVGWVAPGNTSPVGDLSISPSSGTFGGNGPVTITPNGGTLSFAYAGTLSGTQTITLPSGVTVSGSPITLSSSFILVGTGSQISVYSGTSLAGTISVTGARPSGFIKSNATVYMSLSGAKNGFILWDGAGASATNAEGYIGFVR